MAVKYDMLFEELKKRNMKEIKLTRQAGFSGNIMTRIRRNEYVSLESIEKICNVRANAADNDNLNETIERVFRHIEESAKGSDSEDCFSGLFDDFDVNSKSIGETVAKRNKVLVSLLDGVERMPLYSQETINADLFGDAYEYLMGMYAANAGKKGGQYFTPADVSELLTRLGTIGKKDINKAYDPACRSGSLLLKAAKILGKEHVRQGFFGQEIDLTTYNLCRINMFLHNVEFDKISIVREDTREKVDIGKLNAEIKEIVAREQVLRDEIDKIIADIEGGQKA